MRESQRSDLGSHHTLSEIWTPFFVLFTHLKLGGNSPPEPLQDNASVTPSYLSTPKPEPVCPFLSVPQQGFTGGGKMNASSCLKTIAESSQLFPKLDTLFSFPLRRIILSLSSLCLDGRYSSVLCSLPWALEYSCNIMIYKEEVG